jgi:dTMP kinase
MKKSKKGKFIVLEGTDGSGKATQLKLLVSHLKKKGYQVEEADFPQYYSSFFGKLVGRFLKGEFGGINEVSPYLASLTYAGDRFEAKERIKEWLSQGKMVVSNRYTGSNMGHQTAKLSRKEQIKFLRFLEKLEYEVFGIPKEDIVIFLYMPVVIGQLLVDKKGNRGYIGGQERDIAEADLDHQKKSAEVYLRLVRRYPYWFRVNCFADDLLTPQEIHEKVLEVLIKKRIIKK